VLAYNLLRWDEAMFVKNFTKVGVPGAGLSFAAVGWGEFLQNFAETGPVSVSARTWDKLTPMFCRFLQNQRLRAHMGQTIQAIFVSDGIPGRP
jgi:hypothetical protein